MFKGDFSAFHSNRELDHLASSRSVDLAGPAVPGPDAYGQRGLPLLSSPSGAGNHTTSTSSDVGLVGDREIAQKERSIFEDALGKVSAFAQTQGGSSSFGNQLQGAMSNIAQHIDKVKADPDEKARQIGPELRSKVSALILRVHSARCWFSRSSS